MPGQPTDKYTNILYEEVIESGADTLTFKEISIGLSLFDKVGLLIHRLEWYNWHTLLDADADAISFGLSASNGWATVTPAENSIITYHRLQIDAFGAPATALKVETPMVDDLSTLPGGGMLVTPKPLYMFTQGANLASASTIKLRLFFTIIKMRPEDYFELLETRQFFG